MASKFEILGELKPLLTAFEKHFSTELSELWCEELKSFSPGNIRSAVRKVLDSDAKAFPRIGEFKILIRGSKDLRVPEGAPKIPSSCPRCVHGLCSVIREVGHYPAPVRFTFRCTCSSGAHYPGISPVDPFERTEKEARTARKRAWTESPAPPGSPFSQTPENLAKRCLKSMDGICK
jgi:hypothetical protein